MSIFTLKPLFNAVLFVFRGRVITAENDRCSVLLIHYRLQNCTIIACSYYGHCLLTSLTSFELGKCIYIVSLNFETYCASILLFNMNRDHLDEHNYFLHISNLPEQNIEVEMKKSTVSTFLHINFFFSNKKLK